MIIIGSFYINVAFVRNNAYNTYYINNNWRPIWIIFL